MLFLFITIVFGIISFSSRWFMIGAVVSMVLAIVEFILELSVFQAPIFENTILAVCTVILGAAALILTIISIISFINTGNAPAAPISNSTGGDVGNSHDVSFLCYYFLRKLSR